jgi:hypothetical protein
LLSKVYGLCWSILRSEVLGRMPSLVIKLDDGTPISWAFLGNIPRQLMWLNWPELGFDGSLISLHCEVCRPFEETMLKLISIGNISSTRSSQNACCKAISRKVSRLCWWWLVFGWCSAQQRRKSGDVQEVEWEAILENLMVSYCSHGLRRVCELILLGCCCMWKRNHRVKRMVRQMYRFSRLENCIKRPLVIQQPARWQCLVQGAEEGVECEEWISWDLGIHASDSVQPVGNLEAVVAIWAAGLYMIEKVRPIEILGM